MTPLLAPPWSRSIIRAGYRAVAPVSVRFRARVFRRGHDITDSLAHGSALVLAAHPDDETLGCAATILRKREAGVPVHIVIATDGALSHGPRVVARDALVRERQREALEAAARLGLGPGDVTFLGHPDGRLAGQADVLRRQLIEAIRESTPEQIFTNALIDAHRDHQALARATREAVIAARFRGALYEYPIWYWERLPWVHRPRTLPAAAWYLARDPVAELLRTRAHMVHALCHLDRKRWALAAYETQVPGRRETALPPHLPPEFVAHFLQPFEVFYPVRHRQR